MALRKKVLSKVEEIRIDRNRMYRTYEIWRKIEKRATGENREESREKSKLEQRSPEKTCMFLKLNTSSYTSQVLLYLPQRLFLRCNRFPRSIQRKLGGPLRLSQ